MKNLRFLLSLLLAFNITATLHSQTISNVLVRQVNNGVISWQPPSLPGGPQNQSHLFRLFEVKMNISGLPTSTSNPNPTFFFFDPEVIDLRATFISPSGKQKVIHGFYYEDYQLSGCGVAAAPNPLPAPQPGGSTAVNTADFGRNYYEQGLLKGLGDWRIRFAPDEPGDWTYFIELRVNPPGGNTTIVIPLPLNSFFCSAEDARGYARVNKQTLTLEFQDATQLFLVGPIIEKDFSVNDNGTIYAGGICQIKKYMDLLRDAKGNYFRMQMNGAASYENMGNPPQNEFELGILNVFNANYENNTEILTKNAYRYDKILEYAEAYQIPDPEVPGRFTTREDLYIKFSIIGFIDYILSYQNTDKEYTWESIHNPFFMNHAITNCDFVKLDVPPTATQQIVLERITNSLRYIIARWGYSRNIVAWEIIDEVDPCGKSDPHKYANWFSMVSSIIKSLDNDRHLISPGGSTKIDVEIHPHILDVCALPDIDICESNGILLTDHMSGLCGWNNPQFTNLDQVFLRPSNIKMAPPYRPYFYNSLFNVLHPNLPVTSEIADPNGFLMHDAFWRTLMSGGIGMASPFFHFADIFPNISLDPFNTSNKYLIKGQSGQFKPVREFANIMDIGSEFMLPISNIPANANPQNPFFVTNIINTNTNSITPSTLVGQTNAIFTRQYGWLQSPNFGFTGLYSQCGSGSYYTYRVNSPVVNNHYALQVPVLMQGNYKFTWYKTAHLDPVTNEMVHQLEALPPNANNNIIQHPNSGFAFLDIPLPAAGNNVDLSAYGDLVYTIEEIGDLDAGNTTAIDLVRMGDLNNDDYDELIFVNREFNDQKRFKAFNIDISCPGACANNNPAPQFEVNNRKSQYLGWFDQEDLFLVSDVVANIPGKEYIVIDRNHNSNTTGLLFLGIINPANGNFIIGRQASVVSASFLDNNDKVLLGNVDNDVQDEMIFINADPNQNPVAIAVFDPVSNTVLQTIDFTAITGGVDWFNGNDRCFLADIDGGDGKKELVLINSNPFANNFFGFMSVINLTTGTVTKSINYNFPPAPAFQYADYLSGWNCHRVLAGNVTGGPEDEIILINTLTPSASYLVVDPSNLQPMPLMGSSLPAEFTDDNKDRILLADFNADGYKELICVNATPSGQNAFLHINFSGTNAVPTLIPNNGYETWVEVDDVVLTGKLQPYSVKDYLVMVNRNSGPVNTDAVMALDFANPANPVIRNSSPYLPAGASISPYDRFMDNHITYLCDGSVMNNSTQSGDNMGSGQIGGSYNKSGSTGAEDIHNKSNTRFYCYPNPASVFLTIADPSCMYQIFDVLGKKQLEGTPDENKQINISTLSRGVYILNCIYPDGSQYNGRFSKE